GSAGLISVGAQVAVVTDTSSQSAHVDDGAAIKRAGGGIDVGAYANRTVNPEALGGAIGGLAAGAAGSVGDISGDDKASIGNVAIGASGSIGSLTVSATSIIDVPIQAYSVQGGVAAALSGAVPVAEIGGTTQASSGAHGTVGGDVKITADGTHTVSAEA